MKSIARMMKRYVKTPLKYALPLLFIGALVLVSISGCTSTTNNTATNGGHDQLLSAIAANIQSGESANNPTVTNWTVIPNEAPAYLWQAYQKDPNALPDIPASVPRGNYSEVTMNEQWTDSNGVQRGLVAFITNEISTANATADFKYQTAIRGSNGTVSDGHETAYARSEVAAALGHTPTTVNDLSWHYSGEPAAQHEYIQYDNILILLSQNLGITGDSGAVTP
jgi:hypothetical protein